VLTIASVWLVGVVFFDLGWRRVPNTWALAGGLLAIAALLTGYTLFGLTWPASLAGALVAFVVLLCGYALGLMGAGDVKFAAVLGLWLGWSPWLPIAIGAGVLAGAHAALWLALQHWPSTPRWIPQGVGRALQRARQDPALQQIPYAAYLAITALAWLALRASGMSA